MEFYVALLADLMLNIPLEHKDGSSMFFQNVGGQEDVTLQDLFCTFPVRYLE
jgi:hypothetical protein